jgi:hypothetical protein
MMQGIRTENQVEPLRIRKVHQIADLISKVLRRSPLTSDANQRLTDIDANDAIKSFSQDNRMTAGSASSIECSLPVRRQVREQPVLQYSWREACEPIVILGESIEGAMIWMDHLPTVALREWAVKDSNLRPTGYEPAALTT